MIRKLLALLLVISPALFAQSTTVSGTVTDAGSQTWNNGSYSFSFVGIPNYSGPYSWTGGAFNPLATYSGSLNSSGAFSVAVPSNNTITPSGTTWNLKVCPQGSGTCSNQSVTISGTTQTLNPAPPAISVSAANAGAVYATSEVAGGQIGSLIYVLGTGLENCTALTSGSCSTWAAVGSGSSGTQTICHGTITIPSGTAVTTANHSEFTATCTGLATTDNIQVDFNSSPLAVTGWAPTASGILAIYKWPSANTINVSAVNNTGSTITTNADVVLNYRVTR